jgi:hypothetical protein
VFGLLAPASGNGPPTQITGVAIPLGYDYHFPACNPVYRDGRLYFAGHMADANGRYFVRVLRIPLWVDPTGAHLEVGLDASAGFLDFAIGDDVADKLDYLQPSIEVTKNNDMVVAFQRAGTTPEAPLAHGVRYCICRNDRSTPEPSVAIKDGHALSAGAATPTVGKIDLPGTGLDPSDDLTVWIANAYGDADDTLVPLIAGIKP